MQRQVSFRTSECIAIAHIARGSPAGYRPPRWGGADPRRRRRSGAGSRCGRAWNGAHCRARRAQCVPCVGRSLRRRSRLADPTRHVGRSRTDDLHDEGPDNRTVDRPDPRPSNRRLIHVMQRFGRAAATPATALARMLREQGRTALICVVAQICWNRQNGGSMPLQCSPGFARLPAGYK